DDWDRACSFSCREVGRKWRGNDHAGIEAHQLVRQIRQPVAIAVGEPELETDVAALDISELMHALSKACQIAFERFGSSGAYNTDERRDLLPCVPDHRTSRCRTANDREEYPPPHWTYPKARG